MIGLTIPRTSQEGMYRIRMTSQESMFFRSVSKGVDHRELRKPEMCSHREPRYPPHPRLGYNSPGSTGRTPVGEYTSPSAFSRNSTMQEWGRMVVFSLTME